VKEIEQFSCNIVKQNKEVIDPECIWENLLWEILIQKKLEASIFNLKSTTIYD